MSKSKSSVAKKTIKDPELIDMFNKMMGTTDPDPNIVIPKYEQIHGNTHEVVQLLDKIANSPLSVAFSSQFSLGFNQIKIFTKKSLDSLKQMELEINDNVASPDELKAINSNPEKLMEFLNNADRKYKTIGLGVKYTELKESPIVKEMIMTARNLKNAVVMEQTRSKSKKNNLESKELLSENFIINSDGDFLTLFNFTTLDFKQMFYSDVMTPDYKKYVLHVLHLIYVRVINIVKIITSPDIDVDKFSSVVVENIDEMRKHIPRCDSAFNKIQNSVGLLQTNFGDYYKDFVTSQNSNPGIIVENFVLDVAKKNTADPQTTRQFRQIISFYQQQISSKPVKDPRVKKMLGLVGENLDILEDRLENKKKKKEKEPENIDELTVEKITPNRASRRRNNKYVKKTEINNLPNDT